MLEKVCGRNIFSYKMVDSKTFKTQVQELQLIFHDLITEDMIVNEVFQLDAMIEKLLPSWNDFNNYLNTRIRKCSLKIL